MDEPMQGAVFILENLNSSRLQESNDSENTANYGPMGG